MKWSGVHAVPDHTYTVSRDELERLRKQIGDLKGTNPAELRHTATLIESMDRLHEALSRLIIIFDSANRDMAEEAARGIHDEHAKLDRVLEQNEKIARAIVQLADIVKTQREQPFSQRTVSYTSVTPPGPEQGIAPAFAMEPSLVPYSSAPQNAPTAFTPMLQTTPTPSLAPPYTMPAPNNPPMRASLPPLGPLPPLAAFPAQPPSPQVTPPPAAPVFAPRAQPSVSPMQAMPEPARGLPPFPSMTSVPQVPAAMSRPVPPRNAALREQDSFLAQQVNDVQPPLSPDVPLGPPPAPPPPSGTQKRGLLNRFSFS